MLLQLIHITVTLTGREQAEGKPLLVEQVSDSTTYCAICSGRCHKWARTALLTAARWGGPPPASSQGGLTSSPTGWALLFWSLSDGEVKEAAPSTWWSLLWTSNKNSFSTCGAVAQGATPKRNSVHQPMLPKCPDPEKASTASLSDGRKQITQISLLNQDMQFYTV